MIKYLLTIIVMSTLQISAEAVSIQVPKSKCSNLDIRDNMSERMQQYFSTPLNQSGTDWCYAFVTADLVSAHTNAPVSATHIAAIFNQRIQSNFYLKIKHKLISLNTKTAFDNIFVGGWVDTALKYVSDKKKICLEADFPYDKEYRNQTLRALQRLENLKEDIEDELPVSKTCRGIKDIQKQLFLSSNTQDIFDILKREEINIALATIIEGHCKENYITIPKINISSILRPKRIKRAKFKVQQSVTDYFEKIEQVLKKSTPLGVSFNLSHIMNSNINHSSTLTARRWKNGKCQFKIRNTWGQSCNPYDKDKIEECVNNEGSIWVSDQKLYEMINRIDFIQ